jgi:hypothetical protein
MDLSSAFRTEVFRPVATIAIPGTVAIGPYLLVARYHHQFVSRAWQQHPTVTGLVLAFGVVAVGLIIEDIGSRIELLWDHHLKERYEDIETEWYEYLMLAPDPEPIAQRYLRTITLRLKFELGLGLALPIMWVGLAWLEQIVNLWTTWGFVFFSIAVLGLAVYLLWESRSSSEILVRLRQRMVRHYREKAV